MGKAFGFTGPPRVDLNFNARGDKRKNTKSKFQSSYGSSSGDNNIKGKYGSTSGHAFSADNPYGKKAVNDKRQFSR